MPPHRADGRFLYVQTGAAGGVDVFRVAPDGTLSAVQSVTVPAADRRRRDRRLLRHAQCRGTARFPGVAL